MSAQNDVASFLKMLDEMGQKCLDDPAYREELINSGVNDLSDVGASAVMLAEILVRQGADAAEVSAFSMDDLEDVMEDGIVIRTKKKTVRCLTHGTMSGKSCGGRTVILTGGGTGTRHFLEL